MNKSELIQKVADELNLTKQSTSEVLDALLTNITHELTQRNKVSLIGFGTFETRFRPERIGVNPQTGEEITIASSFTPSFKAGKSFKEAVNHKII